ncbi:MAG: hypothetical protein JST18_10985 [Bacteroidetes bacterium]|nr:hypothetical protein [Bacteroidota bacterium]
MKENKNFIRYILLLLPLTVIISCEDEPQEIVTHVHDATIKVRVYQLLNGGGGSSIEVAIGGAVVELYETESDRDLSVNEVLQHSTDTDGNTSFVNLKLDHYYLRCLHPNYGEQLDDVSTPDGTVSFVDFIY